MTLAEEPMNWQWIYDNREWIFDGLGVALLTTLLGAAVWWWQRWRASKKHTDPPPATANGAKNVGVNLQSSTFKGNVTIEQVTAGDTHVHLPPSRDKKSRDARRQTYLHHLFDEASRLSLEGIDRKAAGDKADAAIPLDAIYTALLTEESENDELLHANKGRVTAMQIQESERNRDRPKLSAVAQLDRHERMVLLGLPGSGKSTFVNFVALCLAGHGLENPTVNLDLLIAPLPDDDERVRRNKDEKPTPQPWRHQGLIPIRVILRQFAASGLPAKGEKASANHLWQHICVDLHEASLSDFADELKEELQQKGGLLLLDGLDEVPDAEQQREQLKAVITAFAGAYRKCRILITSRPYAYQQENWRLAGFADSTLAPFSNAQIRLFVERWYGNVAPLRNYKASEAQGRAEQLKSAIFRSDRLRVLAEQPLLLTLMASLHAWHGSDLPDKRERLYAEAVDLLLERWERQRIEHKRDGTPLVQPTLQEYLKVERGAIQIVLEQIAYEVHASQPKLEGTADIGRDRLINGLIAISNNPQVKHLELINYLSERAGLLIPAGNTLYRFPHRTFQEYLAACYLTGKKTDYPEDIAKLLRIDPNRWREVALLAAAKAEFGMGSSLWSMVDEFCPYALGETQLSLDDGWGAHLAGQALVESAGQDVIDAAKAGTLPKHRQEKVQRVRQGLIYVMRSADFVPLERALAGRTLAMLGDPRFDPDRWFLPAEPLLGFVEIPAGKFIMGSDKRKDKAAEDRETPQHEVDLPTFYIARYPVTVAQFRTFVEATQTKLRDEDALRDPDNHPVRYITWVEATAYCDWLDKTLRSSKQTASFLTEKLSQGWKILLASEAEWEKAARGSDGRIYPWGNNEIQPGWANYAATGLNSTSAVGCFAKGISPYGVEEMSGNLWEWTRSLNQQYPYPSDEKRRRDRERVKATDQDRFVLRGGGWGDNPEQLRAAFRYPVHRSFFGDWNYGFRVVCLFAPGS